MVSLAAGERGRIAVEQKVAEANCAKEFQPLGDLAAQALGDESLALREFEVNGRRKRPIEREGGESAMERPPTLTASDSGRRRLPRHTGQGTAGM